MGPDVGYLVVFWVLLSIIPAIAASSRGRSAGEWFIAGLLISPLIALIVVLVLPNERTAESHARFDATHPQLEVESKRGPCPRCGESIPLIAVVCRFCNLDLVDYDKQVLGADESGDP